jgi:hypothetical protein
MLKTLEGSVSNPVICPVFKTGGRRVTPSPVRSTRTRFRQIYANKTVIFAGFCAL